MKLREDLNNLVKKYQSGGLKRLLDEEKISDSNSTINYTKLRNIDPKKNIERQTQKIENVQKKNNVSRKKAIEIIQKKEFDKNVARNPQSVGEIVPVEDQSIASKTWEVLTNPVTAASYWLNDQRIPDRFSKGERNNLDIATDLFNPFGIVDSAKNAVKETINLPKNLYDGEYGEAGSNFLNAGLNTLSVIPALRELKGVKPANIKNTLSDVEKYITTNTPVKDTYKYNPWAFKPNPDAHYRQIFTNDIEGKKMFDIMNDKRIIQSPMQAYRTEAENTKNWIDDAVTPYKDKFILDADDGKFPFQVSKLQSPSEFPFFQKGRPYYGHRRGTSNPNTILIESKPDFHDNMTFQPASINNLFWGDDGDILLKMTNGKTVNIHPNGESLDKFNVYKPHWLQGYKPIQVPKDLYNLENARPSLVDDFSESFGLLGRSAKRFAKTLPIKLLPGHSNRAEKALELGNNWNRDWYNNPITQDRLNNVINNSNFLERIDWKNMQEAIKDEAYISHFQSNLGKIGRFLDGKEHFHNDNAGLSVTGLKESLDPKAPLNKNGTQSFVDKYRPPSGIKSIAIHEGNHNVYTDDSFSGTIFSSMLNKNPEKPLRNIPANKLAGYDNYLSTPEEIYARIQEIRAENKLVPGELLTDKMVDEIFNKGLSGKSNVDSRFYQLIDKDKFKRVVNVIPAVGAVGIGASTVSEKKLGGYRKSLDGLVEKYQKGGSSESKWEYSNTNGKLIPQSQLKSSELGYLKDWLSSPMAKKIAVKREGESGITNLNTRLDRLSDSNLEISTAEDLLKSTNSYTRRRGEKFNNKDLQGTSYTNPSTKYGNIVTRKMAPENVILHEGAHQSTAGNSLLLKNDVEDILSRVRDDSGSYLSNPTEVHARLNVLRKELKDSGVVDPFKTPVSKEHLNKFLNNYKKPGENSDKPLIEANSGELLNILNSQDDAVWLLNNIVDNSNNMNKPFYAQSGGIKPMDRPEQIAWFKEYINSPKYLERLRKEYPNADEETIQRVYETRKANFKDSSDNLSIVKKIDNEADSVLGVQYSRENDYRVDPKYQYKIHDKKAGKIEITEKGLKANPHVVTHEISHGITDGTSKMPTKTIIDIIKRTRGNKPEGFDPEGYARKFSDGFFKNEEKLLESLISIDNDIETYSKKSDAISKANEYFENLDNYSPFSAGEVNTQFNNILYDINGVDGYSKRPTVTDYRSDPTEYLARMQSLRQELKNQGIYDASKEDFTEDHFNKFEKFILDTGPALLQDQYPDLYEFIDATKGSNSFKQPSYKKDADEDIKKGSDTFKENMIWMMNNVAKNTQKNNNIVYSKKGGEIRNSLNNLSKKFL